VTGVQTCALPICGSLKTGVFPIPPFVYVGNAWLGCRGVFESARKGSQGRTDEATYARVSDEKIAIINCFSANQSCGIFAAGLFVKQRSQQIQKLNPPFVAV